jgi:hypothetical protein
MVIESICTYSWPAKIVLYNCDCNLATARLGEVGLDDQDILRETPYERRKIEARKAEESRHVAEAVSLFKAHPNYPRVYVWIHDRLTEISEKATPFSKQLGNPAREEMVLEQFDVRAKGFLGLVSDMKSQDAFITILMLIERLSYQEVFGYPVEVLRPIGPCRFLDAI